MIRRMSWAVFAASLVLPTVWAGMQLASFSQSHSGPACGMPVLAIVGLAMLGSGALSLVSAALSFAALRRLPRPRGALRKAEVALLAVPAVLGAMVAILALYA